MENIFLKYVPEAAAEYCSSLHQQHNFYFIISQKRKSKLGDFRYDSSKRPVYTITVNYDLNPYLFLLTYLHELAHLQVHLKYKNRVLPHGHEWKEIFTALARPVLHESVFPADLLRVLLQYFRNPAASYYGNTAVAAVMQRYDSLQTIPHSGEVKLGALRSGEQFVFQHRLFEKIVLKRTRVLCKEVASGKHYLIHQLAIVKRKSD